jgi:hypothetical protein
MQDDTDRTFEEIHGSPEKLLSAIEEIERVALIERSDDAPMRLRFIIPYSSGNPECDFAITPIDAFQGDESYVAVSYTWAHDQSIEGLEIPAYRIRDMAEPNSPPRSLRCAPIVFHRAVRYARAKGYEYVWIDQECIHQEDSADVERHLQIMHRIYRASKVTIGVLSCVLPQSPFAEEFALWNAASVTHRRLPPSDDLADWLVDLSHDKWFTRTWTMQEQNSAHKLVYLIPMASTEML